MRHDVTAVLSRHVQELFEILELYDIKTSDDFVATAESDIVYQKAVLMTIGYIGELSKKLPDTIKQKHQEINWRRLATSRNIIFHDYDVVDMHIISTVVFKDIMVLRDILNR